MTARVGRGTHTFRLAVASVSVALLLSVLVASGQSTSKAPATPYPPSAAHPGPAWFEDVAGKAGLRMMNVNGKAGTKNYIIETTGGGVAVIDFDHDGWPDIFVVNGTTLEARKDGPAPTSHLFRNNHDGSFSDVTAKAGLLFTGWGQGACVGDYDHDGFDDLFVTYYGKNRLYRNQGDGTFRNVAEEMGVAGDGSRWGTGCAFVDYDRDGVLDLLVANYVQLDMKTVPKPGEGLMCIWKGTPVECGPRGLPYTTNILYHGRKGGRFEDVSEAAGIRRTNGHYCFSVSTLDYNRDGWPDIYVACDSTPAILYKNNKNGTFTDVAPDVEAAYNEDGREQAGMGSAVGDYDGDGWPDIFKTNFSDDTSSLYHNQRDGTFTSAIAQAGLELNTQYLGWGTAFVDPDNSGWLSILSANGHVYPEVDTNHLGSAYKEPRLLYENQRNGKFRDISASSGPGITTPASSRGLAVADFWNDGRQSVVINNIDAAPMLLVNLAANAHHWLGISLEGTRSNRDGIGAQVRVMANKQSWVQEVRSGSSYLSNHDMRLHFGLGDADKVGTIEVTWPSGLRENFAASSVDRYVSLIEGKGEAAVPAPAGPPAVR